MVAGYSKLLILFVSFIFIIKRAVQNLGSNCCGQVVSVLAIYSVNPSSNPAEVYCFISINCLKRMKINKNARGWHILLKKLPNSHHSCLLEVRVCAVTGLDDAVAAVEDRDHEHAEGEHVAGRGAN